MYIIRMVIESAGIYTIQILILNILFFKGDNFQYVIQAAIIPSIGACRLLWASQPATRWEPSPRER